MNMPPPLKFGELPTTQALHRDKVHSTCIPPNSTVFHEEKQWEGGWVGGRGQVGSDGGRHAASFVPVGGRWWPIGKLCSSLVHKRPYRRIQMYRGNFEGRIPLRLPKTQLLFALGASARCWQRRVIEAMECQMNIPRLLSDRLLIVGKVAYKHTATQFVLVGPDGCKLSHLSLLPWWTEISVWSAWPHLWQALHAHNRQCHATGVEGWSSGGCSLHMSHNSTGCTVNTTELIHVHM